MEQSAQQPQLNALGKLTAQLAHYGQNASNNLTDTFNNMTLHSWLRLVIIVCGYMLLRPYVIKLGAKTAIKKMEEEDTKSKAENVIDPDMTPNEFRGIKEKLDEPVDEGDGTGADWGTKARVRQRQMLKNMLEEEERRRAAEHEDADIQEYLED